ncbi:MAG: hypothetical protein AAFV43_13285 [Planctomycetota bacterium]
MLLSQLTVAVIAALPTPTAPADWKADYGEALEATRQTDKPLIVVIDRPEVESERLSPELLSPNSGAFPLGAYSLCRVDASTEYGKKVAEVFRVTSFPHVAIIDKTGSIILKRMSGDISRDAWTTTLETHRDGSRRTTGRYTVAKPIVSSSATTTTPSVGLPTSSFVIPQSTAQPYCPSCQLR